MTEAQYTRVTYDLAMSWAHVLARANPALRLLYVSGMGTGGKAMWARVKGRTERDLLALLPQATMIRLGALRLLHGERTKTRGGSLLLAALSPFWPALQWLWPSGVITSEELGRAVLTIARVSGPKRVLENASLVALGRHRQCVQKRPRRLADERGQWHAERTEARACRAGIETEHPMIAMHPHGYALDTTWRTLLKGLGIVPANVPRRAGLPDDLLRQPSVRLESEAYYRLWKRIEAETADPLLPIRLCEAVRSESFSPPLFAALCSPNLLVAAQRIARYKRLVAPMRLDVIQEGGTATVKLTWLDTPLTPPSSLVIMKLLFCVLLARMGTRQRVCPLRVTTSVRPTDLAPCEAFLGAPIRQDARHRVVFAATDAARPFLPPMSRCGRPSSPGCASASPT